MLQVPIKGVVEHLTNLKKEKKKTINYLASEKNLVNRQINNQLLAKIGIIVSQEKVFKYSSI